MTNYDENSIVTLDTLSHMRLRLNSYIRDTNVGGQFHLIKEAVDNAVDEAALMDGSGKVDILMFRSKRTGTYQIVVVDNGRGMPVGKMLDILLKGNTSGKFNQDNYAIGTGSNGIGIKAAVASASDFRCIAFNGETAGDTLTFNHAKLPAKVTLSKNARNKKGTMVMWSPDPEVLHEILSFTNDYGLLYEHLQTSSLFANYRIRFYLIESLIPKKLMNAETDEFVKFIDSRLNYQPTFDSTLFDKEAYVKGFFNVSQSFLDTSSFQYKGTTGKHLSIDLQLMVLLTRNVSNNRLTFVNNIIFTDRSCYQYTLLIDYLKTKLSAFISSPAIVNFFIDHYTLPIWVYGDIKYGGAVFVGLDKTAFRDDTFKPKYVKALSKMIPDQYIDALYALIAEHIQAAYDKFSNKHLKVSNNKSLLTQLNFPTKFADCRAKDRSDTELFLMEGDSAKSDKARDPQYQAGYALRGKPINGITTPDNMEGGINKLKANLIFQDVVKILNIQDGTTNNLYFNTLFIATDADAHGYHIADIILANLYALCPEFLESGRVHLVIPPHYEIKVGKETIFARNTTELNSILSQDIYYEFLEIRLRSDRFDKVLSHEEFIAFNEMVSTMGDAISAIADEHFIHPVILEQLSLLTNMVDFDNPDVLMLSKAFGNTVKYNAQTHVMTVSIGTSDIVVPLVRIKEIIYSQILPLFRSFYYNRTDIFVTTKKTPSFKGHQVSIVQLYQMQEELRKLLRIRPLKGLGSMSPKEIEATCINRQTRRSKQVTSIGDVDTIFRMMGSDSRWRKELVLAGYKGLM